MAKKKAPKVRAPTREMAAVMFTDVRGYSTLTQHDEALALRLLDVKQGLAAPLIAKHHGRLVKTIGEALMVEFKSALAAVQCAVALQKRLHEHNATRPAVERLQVRIGVHVGNVIRKGDDLLGDTVNVAARVEPEAPPGGIAVTQAVYDQLRGKLDLPLGALGGFRLKGLREEMELYSVTLPWQAAPSDAAWPGLLTRLKQHHLFRVVSLYATVGWVLILVANQVFPDIGLSREDVRYLIAGVALLFPVTVAFAWMFIPPSRENPDRYTRWKRVRFRTGMVFSGLAVAIATVSGAYLWRLDSRRLAPASGVQAVVVLPFEKVGPVDEATLAGLRNAIEVSLSALSSVRVIPRAAYEPSTGPQPALADIIKSTGATLFLQGSVQRGEGAGPYTIQIEVVSAQGPETLYSYTNTFAGNAPIVSLDQQVASLATGPVRFLTRGDDWMAKGYPVPSDPRAMPGLRKALMSYFYGSGQEVQLLHEVIGLAPDFAQAHAYLGFFLYQQSGSSGHIPEADAEIATAEKLAPGLPEAALARGEFQSGSGDDAGAIKSCVTLEASLPNNIFRHNCLAWAYWDLRRWDDALNEFKANAALDPYQLRTSGLVARVGYAKGDLDGTAEFLVDVEKRWPLYPSVHLWRLHLDFDYHGDLAKLTKGIEGDWTPYGVDADTDWILGRRIEVEHLLGKHVDVLKDLKAYPHDCSTGSLFGTLTHRIICTDAFAAESDRLLGRDGDAADVAATALPHLLQSLQPDDTFDRVRIALLQAFGGRAGDVEATLKPFLASLAAPPGEWNSDQATYSVDAAAALAWAGQKSDAIALLGKSLDAVWGVHANVLATDPVWRPLYAEPGFKALLAQHGATLAYAK